MCGTFTAIFGEALALFLVDSFIRPSLVSMGEVRMLIELLIKGISTFWIYKWAQCLPAGTHNRRPLHGMSFMTLVFGGMIGAVTLMLSKSLLPRQSEIMKNDYMGYLIDAVIVNFVYGMAQSTIEGLTP